jgi:DNA-binding IclR family transcriptional regulator
MFSHNISTRMRSTPLAPNSRVRRPQERRSLSRSATRALDVLEYFGNVRRPLRAVEIAQALGLHPSTTDQLLKTMVDSAHLVFEARSKLYFPSPRLVRFGAWLTERYFGDDRIRRTLEAVQSGSGEAVTLSVQNDLFMQLVDAVDPIWQSDQIERGLKAPLFGSAIGAALLATRADGEIEALMERARASAGDRPAILAGIRRVREDGYAFGGISTDDEIRSIAVALPASPAGVPMVLGLAGPADRIERRRDELVELMRASIARWIGEG